MFEIKAVSCRYTWFGNVNTENTGHFQDTDGVTYMYHKHGPKADSWFKRRLTEDVSTARNYAHVLLNTCAHQLHSFFLFFFHKFV